MDKRLGLFYALVAYVCWGLFPIYWKFMLHIDSIQIVAHRMFWSFFWILIPVIVLRQWSDIERALRDRRLGLVLACGSLLMALNWGVYVWAVNASYIIEVSMGYFINPLLTVLLGVVFLRERLRKMQMLAMVIVGCGIAYTVIMHGAVPWIALALSSTFALYSLVKKSVNIPANLSLVFETGFMVIPAFAFLLYSEVVYPETSVFRIKFSDTLLLIFGGLITLVPLVLFASAAKKISMTALGMSQYIGPSLQLALAVYVYNEPFDQSQLVAFSLIWLALVIYTADQLNHHRRYGVVPI